MSTEGVDQSGSVSRVDLSRWSGGADPSSGVVEVPDDQLFDSLITGPVEAGAPEPAVTHLAVIQASLPPGLTEVAGGGEGHCRARLERWVAERGLRDGERAVIVAVLAETVVEPGVGVYTVPAARP